MSATSSPGLAYARSTWLSLRQWLRQDVALERAGRTTPQVRARIQPLHEAARTRRALAQRIEPDGELQGASLSSLREAMLLHAMAYLAIHGEEVELMGEPWAVARGRVEEVLAREPPGGSVTEVLDALDPSQLVRFEERAAGDRRELHGAACALVDHLQGTYEIRPDDVVRRARARRSAAVASGGLALGAMLLVAIIVRILAPTNVARGRLVTSSSVFPTGRPPETLVNGKIEDIYASATLTESEAWFVVDLGRPYAIVEISVYGRGDNYVPPGFPLVLEAWTEGTSPRVLDTRTEPFFHWSNWHIKGDFGSARFVRVRTTTSPAQLALSEIEIRARTP